MRIEETMRKERIVRLITEAEALRIITTTVSKPKSAAEISEELQIPERTVYRHISELCDSGLLTSEKNVIMEGGGKYVLYRSMVKSIAVKYDSGGEGLEVELIPNENLLYKFVRFWTYMGSA